MSSSDTMSDDFGDDDVFDGVDVEAMLQSSQVAKDQLDGRNKLQKRPSDGLSTQDDDDQPTTSSKRQKTDQQDWQDTPQDDENVQVARDLLAQKFGYQDFRHEQQGAIRRILAGQNTLVIFPTGAGKSLCYQVSYFHSFLVTLP